MSNGDVTDLLDCALDLGITLIDTARGYGLSEERIGRHLRGRRRDVIVSSKGGYGATDATDWTPPAITRGIDDALARLQTDHIDIFHLHSCPLEVLLRSDLLEALDAAKHAGKISVAAYSGDNEALAWALESGRFGSIQCSLNPFDQRALPLLADVARRGLGAIAKRPVGNAPWRFSTRPTGDYAEIYWERMMAMSLPFSADEWPDVALRFSAFTPGVSSVILGTSNREHLVQAARAIALGPLEPYVAAQISTAFRLHGGDWLGQT